MKKVLYALSILAIGSAAFFTSCKKESEPALDEVTQGYDYFPLEIGKYITYKVDSTVYDDFKKITAVTSYQMRYQTMDTFRDASDRLSYTINIYIKKNDADEFTPHDVIHVTRNDYNLEYSQLNNTFIKLAFPIDNGKTWDGNSMIASSNTSNSEYTDYNWAYTYADFNTNYTAGVITYPNSVTVNEIDETVNDPDADSTAYASRNFAQEVYAYGVGMIYRERIFWVFQPSANNQGGSGYRSGYGVIMTIVDHN